MLYHVGKEMEGGIKNSQILSLENLHNSFELPTSSQDDFLEQILSSLPNSPWPDPNPNPNPKAAYPSLQDHLLQQQLLLSRGAGASGLMPDLPLSLDAGADGSSFKSSPQGAQALFNAFSGALHGNAQATVPHQPFQAGTMSQPPAGTSTGGSSGQAPQRQRVRARRGQATDPHSIAERLRRERIAERMKALQELVPNGNKTDKASMLDEIIDYVKFLQLQVKVLSMSRLGGAAATPRVADLSSEGNQVMGTSANGMSVTEHQVVKLMEEDMGSAMQYLQGKGLCLMPISLATAISTATCQPRNSNNPHQQHQSNGGVAGGQGPSSPNLSALTVQPANLVNGDGSVKDSINPASKA